MNRKFESEIDPGHPAMAGHFPGDPVVPGVVILSEVEDAVRSFVGEVTAIVSFPKVKFLAILRPKQRFRIELRQGDSSSFRFTVRRGETRIAEGTVKCRSGTCSA